MNFNYGKNLGKSAGTGPTTPFNVQRNVLIVDDNKLICWSLQKVITRDLGFNVVSVSTGEEALKLLEESKFHLIILDYALPGISGLEVLSKLRERGNLIPVIMISASGSLDLDKIALKSGAVHFMEKPFNLNLIKSKIIHFII